MKLWEEKSFLDKAAIINLIAVGDSLLEMEAARYFAEQSDRCLAKLIKFRENPTFQELRKELEVMNTQFTHIFSQCRNVNIKLEREISAK